MNSESPNIVTLIAGYCHNEAVADFLVRQENIIFSWVVMVTLATLAYAASRKKALIPAGVQNVMEMLVGGIDDFVQGILGERNRYLTPFIGTLFIYILCMNLLGQIPLFKAPTASWSTTAALALVVFVYVQYTAFKELGPGGYIDHLAGNPRGFLLYSVIIPVFLFCIHLMSEFIKPITLSLRLRSNIWGDDYLLSLLAGFGFKGLPLLFFTSLIALLAAVVQAAVFALLATIYFALVMNHQTGHQVKEAKN